MARGVNWQSSNGFTQGGPPTGPCNASPTAEPIAQAILARFDIPQQGNVLGSELVGYDIKSQDALTMMKLSLTAEAFLGGGESIGREVYINKDGVATLVKIDEDNGSNMFNSSKCLYSESLSEYKEDIDHVIVRGGDPLPYKKYGKTISMLNNPSIIQSQFSCGFAPQQKNISLQQEAWVLTGKNPQDPTVQDEIRNAVDRENWEQGMGYKYVLGPIRDSCSFQQSQTTPLTYDINTAGISTSISMNLGSPVPWEGGIVDISNVNAIGAQVIDITTGEDLASIISTGGGISSNPWYGLTKNDIYVLLDHSCGIISLSRGQNWFLENGGHNSAVVRVIRGPGSELSYKVFSAWTDYNIYYFRRRYGSVGSLADFITYNIKGEFPPEDFSYDPDVRSPSTPRDAFDSEGGAVETSIHSPIRPGFGTNGMEMASLSIAYTSQLPSIKVRSTGSDAAEGAADIIANGIFYVPVVVVDKPAPTGWNKSTEVIYPPTPKVNPENLTGAPPLYCPELPIEQIEGSIVDLSAPFLNESSVVNAAKKIENYINGCEGDYKIITFEGAEGHLAFPGMKYGSDGVIHSIEFSYNDLDSVTTNLTVGPRYFEPNSYNDSKYVKKSETITRTGRVIGASNGAGEFLVHLDGLGVFNALNSILDSIHAGDRVEVKVTNYPVEP